MLTVVRGAVMFVVAAAVAMFPVADACAAKPVLNEEFFDAPLFGVTSTGAIDTTTVSETGVGTVKVFLRKTSASAQIVYTGKVVNDSKKAFRLRFKAFFEVRSLSNQSFLANVDYRVTKAGDATVKVDLQGKGFELPPDFDPTDLGLPFFSGF